MKLFFKNTDLAHFFTLKEYPFFYSTYYANKNPYFLTSFKKKLLNLISEDLNKAYKFLSASPKKNYQYQLLKEEISILLNNLPKSQILDIKVPFYAPKALKAKKLYLTSLYEIYQTDFNKATQNLSSALKIFKQKKHYFECGLCYISLAKVYKICGCFDITYTLLQEAEKIYKTQCYSPSLIAEIKANYGLNELIYENYDNAVSYLKEALDLCQKHNFLTIKANIINWQTLIYLIKNDTDKALKTLQSIKEPTPLPKATKLFKYELLSRIYKQQKKYSNSLKNIDLGLKLAQELKNEQEIFELSYLKADIYFIKNELKKAKSILTKLIKQKHSPNLFIFKANAYTLLGLIAIKENDLPRAKNLFKASLDLENSKSRQKAIAIDYNNLAYISQKQGNKQEANSYLKLALEIAQEINDDDLINYLQNKTS